MVFNPGNNKGTSHPPCVRIQPYTKLLDEKGKEDPGRRRIGNPLLLLFFRLEGKDLNHSTTRGDQSTPTECRTLPTVLLGDRPQVYYHKTLRDE